MKVIYSVLNDRFLRPGSGANDRVALRLGLIGAGTIGRAILRAFLQDTTGIYLVERECLLSMMIDHDLVLDVQILVSTRRPEVITENVPICFDNQRVINYMNNLLTNRSCSMKVFRESDLIFISVLPHQLCAVAADYHRAGTAGHGIVAVLSSSIPTRKLQAMFSRDDKDTVVHLKAVLNGVMLIT